MATEPETRTAAEIGGVAELGDEAKALLSEQPGPAAYVASLRERGLTRDAVAFIAHWLPKRAAIWWGCLCVWHVGRPGLPPKEEAALRAVVRWVRDPSDVRRQALQAAGDAAGGTQCAAGGLAYAAFFSGGSLTPPDLPVVPPPPELMANTLARVLSLAAASGEGDAPLESDFIELGLEVAAEDNRWS